ncbi:MAG: formaldehyde-activating enzyme [Actinobacteria bacterium]|nr:formaldehyde-activating enzyme [Actinomycetota bacterium]
MGHLICGASNHRGRPESWHDTHMQIGEAFIGVGAEAAHVNTILGDRSGPVGAAWATGLATPSSGHAAFVAVLQPGVPVQPMTLFVNKAEIAHGDHGTLTWGPAQAGVAAGVADAVADGLIEATSVALQCLIAAVWVNPEASDADLVFVNNRKATHDAIANGRRNEPDLRTVLDARDDVFNPYYRAPSK